MIPASARAALRVARRTARRDWKRTGFVVALIAMPVAAAIVVAGIARSNEIDPATEVAARFGSATLRVEGYAMRRGEVARRIDEIGSPDSPSLSYRSLWVDFGGMGSDAALAEDLDIDDPLASGILTIVEGSPPEAPAEVALSAHLADQLAVGVGDEAALQLSGAEQRVTITGIVANPADFGDRRLLFTPEGLDAILQPASRLDLSSVWLFDAQRPDQAARAINEAEERRWEEANAAYPPELTAVADASLLSQLDAEQIEALVELAPTVSLDELYAAVADMLRGRAEVSTSSLWAESSDELLVSLGEDDVLTQPAVVGTLVAALLLAEVALVAGAAYATGTRRRLREIGLLTANGATDRHVRLVVVGEGLVAGVLGASIGIGMALAGLALGAPILQGFARKLVAAVPVTMVDVVAPAIAGIVAATVAAWLPARTAARVPTTTALQGRMPVAAPARWVVPLGVALAGFGTFLIVVARTAFTGAAAAQAGLGVVLMIGGFALLTGPMVAWAGRFADRFRATPRLVLRDSARQRTRAAAAVAAMMVVLIAPVVTGASLATERQRDLIYGLPQPGNQVVVTVYDEFGLIIDVSDQDVARVQTVLPEAAVVRFETRQAHAVPATQAVVDPNDPESNAILPVAIGNAALATALDTPEIVEHLAVGVPVVLGVEDRPTEVTIDGRSFQARELPVAVTWGMPRLLVPAALATEQGWEQAGDQALFVLDHDTTDDQESALWNLDGLSVSLTSTGLLSSSEWMLVGLAATLVVMLVITGLVTALAAAESDQDLAVMTAVGAPPAMRRRFLGIQTGYYAAFAAALAVPLGLLLLKVTTGGQDWTDVGPFGSQPGDALVVPWAIIGLLTLVFPVVVGGLTALVVRSSPTVPPRRAT